MATKTKATQPQPVMDTVVAPPVPANEPQQEIEVRQKAGKPSLAASISANNAKRLAEKQRILGSASQLLAEVVDRSRDGQAFDTETQQTAARAGLLLYQGRRDGILNAEEVSNTLGQQFGFKVTSTGKPSKTPAGAGEGIRKRVVRLIAGHEYVEGENENSFFEPLAIDDVAPVMADVDDGSLTIWEAYDKLAEMRKKALEGTRPELVFDARRIAGMAVKLGQSIEVSAQHFADDANLVEAWAGLIDTFKLVDEAAANIVLARQEEAATEAAE